MREEREVREASQGERYGIPAKRRADQGRSQHSTMAPRLACGERSPKENRKEVATCARSKLKEVKVNGPAKGTWAKREKLLGPNGGQAWASPKREETEWRPKAMSRGAWVQTGGGDSTQGGKVDQGKVGFELLFMKSNISKEFELGSNFNPNFSTKFQF